MKRLEKDGSPIAPWLALAADQPERGETLRQIAELYAIEKTVRGSAPEARLTARRELSAPIIEAFRPWLEAQLSRIPKSSKLAEDIRYTLARWAGLTPERYGSTAFSLEDGCLELDTNPVENQIRKIALTRKNALFAGHEVGAENWALLASLIANCKIGDVDPVSYLTDTLQALLDGHPKTASMNSCLGTPRPRQTKPHRGAMKCLRCNLPMQLELSSANGALVNEELDKLAIGNSDWSARMPYDTTITVDSIGLREATTSDAMANGVIYRSGSAIPFDTSGQLVVEPRDDGALYPAGRYRDVISITVFPEGGAGV